MTEETANANAVNDNSELREAIVADKVDYVEEWLGNDGNDVNQCFSDGHSPLTLASDGGKSDRVVDMLCRHSSTDVNLTVTLTGDIGEEYEQTALLLAASNGHRETIEVLLKHGNIAVNCLNNYRETPLQVAASKGHAGAVEALLKHPDIDVMSKESDVTALIVSASYGHYDVVKTLLAHGEGDKRGVNRIARQRYTPLIVAAGSGHMDIIEALLECSEIDVNIRDDDDDNALRRASDHPDVVKLLLDYEKTDVNSPDDKGNTELMWAAKENNIQYAKMLLEHKGIANHNSVNNKGDTALLIATSENHVEMTELLLTDDNVDVNTANPDRGYTSLCIASSQGNMELLEMLLNHQETNVNAVYDICWNPLGIAAYNDNVDVVTALLKDVRLNLTADGELAAGRCDETSECRRLIEQAVSAGKKCSEE